MKIFDLTHDSIEVHARPPSTLRRVLPDGDPRLEGIPEGYVEMTARAGDETLIFWLPPEAANKLSVALDDKKRQCHAREYDPT
jgi:hypothetical protein